MIYSLEGRQVPGFAIGGDERTNRLRAAFAELLDNIKGFGGSLEGREKVVLEIGLTASHVEESLAHGDWKRAEAHIERLTELLETFRQGTARGVGTGQWWPWSPKWRYFFGMEAGHVVSREGPVRLSDYDAGSREADIVQKGLVQGRAISPIRYDWDDSAGQWRRA